MAAPSKAWVTQADSQIDADSPIDSVLMTGYRDDLVHLREWLGLGYTAAQNHDHDGVNSKQVVTIADGAVNTSAKVAANVINTTHLIDANVTLAKLKWTTGSWSQILPDNLENAYDVTISQHSHNFRTDMSSSSALYYVRIMLGGGHPVNGQDIKMRVFAQGGAGITAYASWDYHIN